MKEKRKTLKLNFNTMLVAFSVVPMMISIIIMLIMLISTSSAEIKGVTQNSMLSLVKETGAGFESYIKNGESTLKNFAKSPIVVEFLKNQTDAALKKEAQDYTMDCFNAAGNMEAIYISNWDSTTLTHPVEKAIGAPTREGDRLKSLQENMLASDEIYSTGIMASPATGKQVVSMYAPVFDDKNNPIGYVGAAVYLNDVAEMFSDTSSMGYDSMYVYTVNGHDGIMIQHPNEEKVGQLVENEAVKQVLARISNNEEVEPGFISYVFNGANKYAAYFVGKNNDYITVLTVDEKDVLSEINKVSSVFIMTAIALMVAFVIITLILSRRIAAPLKKLDEFTKELANGKLDANIETTAQVKEISSIIDSANILKSTMKRVLSNIHTTMEELDQNMIGVDDSIGACSNAVSGVSAVIDGISSGAVSMSESVQTTASNMVTVGNNITDIQTAVGHAKENADEVCEISTEVRENLDKLIEANKHTIQISQEVAKGIAESNEAVEAINMATDVITSIASQTNLLSLNASIEAARAGEQGKGFAVVASEIKTLAEQSTESAQEIRNIITNLVQKFGVSTELVEKIQESVTIEGDVLDGVQESFNKVTHSMDQTSENINDIYGRTNELSTAKDNVLTEVSNLSAISQENAASCVETTSVIENINDTIEKISSSSKDTIHISKNLEQEVNYFNI